MKSLILLAFLTTFLIVQVHGCTVVELARCAQVDATCEGMLKSIECFKDCNQNVPSTVMKALKEAGCGASGLTNLGLPMMLLVAVVAFYNKQ